MNHAPHTTTTNITTHAETSTAGALAMGGAVPIVGSVAAAAAAAMAAGQAADTFTVPIRAMGSVIGRGGENVRDLQSRLGVHVQIQRESEMLPGQTERSITITGPVDGVAAARAHIMSILDTRRGEASGGGGAPPSYAPPPGTPSVTITGSIPEGRVGQLIGRGGSTIQGLQRKFAVHIQVRWLPARRNCTHSPRCAPFAHAPPHSPHTCSCRASRTRKAVGCGR